ncbi:heparinase II/III-family protein [Mesorhizobium sp.]|uniref:heparinase II/III family protein n=1 Tax=Mesorhizobium sp. TaxID=1871066 RepID=UPI000FE9C649|nr:heparinase II/III-family protein [Mesorhizobium sp.]RWK58961.1 MAG: heparinase [Mesorhizobium sp.]RWM43084.1 MAG: heparinase [Mesorhizobium sp.]RWM46747.1 MAG: heparinase [Mesorhizobium sp.]RWM49187.1 MAG: heparinase [Mesorhizobium sp.]RWM91654.1 MAG: heparinase [Mesorhizobium sp.]
MRIGWYINRLRSMEPAEVLHRLGEQRRRIASRRRDDGWERYASPQLHPVLRELRDATLAATPEQRQAIAAAAQNTLGGQFSALGQTWPRRDSDRLFPPELWRLDPVTGRLWPGPEAHTFDIDFRHVGERGDVKYVWEINRLQQLPPLAAHLLLAGDDQCRMAIEAAIDSWHSANPPFRGVCWASGIEVALRAISLIVTIDLVGDRLSAATRQQVGEILAASAYWLPRFPSQFSSANNHLVAELAGEYLTGLALGTAPDAARGALLAEARKQILADGAGAEQTPTYAAFSAELILLCAAAARQAGAPFPSPVEARLAAFANFVAWLSPAAGFGDNDEGRVLTLGDDPDYVRSVAAAIHGFLRMPGNTAAPDDFRALCFGTPSEPALASHGLQTFTQGGLSVWRGEMNGRSIDLTFDHGPLGYLSIAAHGHADALSLTLCVDGEPVLVDPGTWLYGSGGVWRDWFRSTPAHNTLNIEGKSQSIIAGMFNWSHKAAAALVESEPGTHWKLRARHDGYRSRFGVVHQRTVMHQADGIVVTDQLLGGRRVAEVVFQLAAGLGTNRDGSTIMVLRGDEPLMAIRFPDAAVEIRAGGDAPGQGGWVSPRFGARQPAERIAWHGEVGEDGIKIHLAAIPPS